MDREVRTLGSAAGRGSERDADVERAAAGRELGALEVGAERERRRRRSVHGRGVASADVADDLALGRGDDPARDGRFEGREVTAAGAIRGGEAAVGVDRDERRDVRGGGLAADRAAAFARLFRGHSCEALTVGRRPGRHGCGLCSRRCGRGHRFALAVGVVALHAEARARRRNRRARRLARDRRRVLALSRAAHRGPTGDEHPRDHDRHPTAQHRFHAFPRHPQPSNGSASRELGRVSFASDLGGSNRAWRRCGSDDRASSPDPSAPRATVVTARAYSGRSRGI